MRFPLSTPTGGEHRESDPCWGRKTALAGDYIFFEPYEYQELTREEAEDYRVVPRQISQDHQKVFVDSKYYYLANIRGDQIVDNEPVETEMAQPEVSTVGNANQVVDATLQHGGSGSPDPSFPTVAVPLTTGLPTSVRTAAPPVAGSGISALSTVDSSNMISQFPREVGLRNNEVTIDVTDVQDAMENFHGATSLPRSGH